MKDVMNVIEGNISKDNVEYTILNSYDMDNLYVVYNHDSNKKEFVEINFL